MRIIQFILFIALTLNSLAQTPNWVWAKSAGENNADEASSATTDGSGNIYVVGIYSDTISFNGAILTPNNNLFIVKYDSNGNIIWARSADGNYSYVDERLNISTDHQGNFYVAGCFSSDSLVFGSQILTHLKKPAGQDIFLAKFDSSGTVLWAKSASGRFQDDKPSSVHVDKFDNVYVGGYFSSDTLWFDTTALIEAGLGDIFLAKYNSNGDLKWAINPGGERYEEGSSITSDTSGNVYLVGRFQSDTILFNSIQLYNPYVPHDDMFIVKYDSSANIIWAKNAGPYDSWAQSAAVDLFGNIYVTGSFAGDSISFDNIKLFNTSSSFTSTDIFVLKYDHQGNVLWAKGVEGKTLDYSSSITTDKAGNVYITGNFQSDSLYFDSKLIIRNDGIDIFLAEYDSSGNAIWAKGNGGTSHDQATCVTIDSSDNVYTVGFYASANMNFDGSIINNVSAFNYDMFIAKVGLLTSYATIENKNASQIYPNPFMTYTTFHTDVVLNKATLSVYNSFGKIVRQIKNISGQTIVLNRDNLPSGLYLILVTEDNKVLTSNKLIITG
jgi:hypothetical protein